MTEERYQELMDDLKATLTQKELDEGWHFCTHWDGLLIGPGMMEFKHCRDMTVLTLKDEDR